ncbi:MAG: glycosyltransferase family 39 protein, partial [Pseudomonadota bacterium]
MNSQIRLFFYFSFFLKLALSLMFPLVLDEYYYFLWGGHFSWSYFDHPPIVGWMMSLSQPLAEWSPGLIRWPFVAMGQLTIAIWLRMLKTDLSEKALMLFLLVATFNPLWGLGQMIATPDIPLVCFWSLALFFTKEVIDKSSVSSYAGLGLALGLGFSSKYHVVLFIPCLFILIWRKKLWNGLLNAKTFLTLGLGMMGSLPVLYWNSQNEWASFLFQWEHGMGGKYWKPTYPLEYLGNQLLLIGPLVLWALVGGQKEKRRAEWLLPFTLFPFVFFLYSSFKGRVEGNWVIMSFPSLYAYTILTLKESSIHWIQKMVATWVSLL